MKSFQTKLKKEVASFDGDAWQEAVKESGIEIVDKKDEAKSSAKSVSEPETIEVAETDVKPISKNTAKTKSATSPTEKNPEKTEEVFGLKKPCKGDVVLKCSLEELIFYEGTNDWRTHNGVDFSGEEGDPVYATADGVVSQIYEDELLGTVLVLEHKNGMVSIYGNIRDADFMKVGTAVKQGDVTGAIGKSGVLEKNSDSHLHFELKENGEYVDPLKYFDAD